MKINYLNKYNFKLKSVQSINDKIRNNNDDDFLKNLFVNTISCQADDTKNFRKPMKIE